MDIEFDRDLISDILQTMVKIQNIKCDLSRHINTYSLQIPGWQLFNSSRGYIKGDIMIFGLEHSGYDIIPIDEDMNHENYCHVYADSIMFPNRGTIMDGIANYYLHSTDGNLFHFNRSFHDSVSIPQINEEENLNLPEDYFSWTPEDILMLKMAI